MTLDSSNDHKPAPEDMGNTSVSEAGEVTWQERAMRLQAEMENYRKRQRRLAEEQIKREREHLLRRFLEVADELEHALDTQSSSDLPSLRQGLELTYRNLINLLAQEGVYQMEAQGQPFDPHLHEAVGSATQPGSSSHPPLIVQVLRPGYYLNERLLRPATVLVST